MARQLPASSMLTAVGAAVLTIAAVLLLVLAGQDEEGASADGGGSEQQALPDLPDGFTAIPPEEFFQTLTEAQRRAGSWRVVSVSENDGQPSPPSVQDYAKTDTGAAYRLVMQGEQGPVEARWVDGAFYLKGLGTSGPTEPWWRVSETGKTGKYVAALLASADPAEQLKGLGAPAEFEVVGVEEVEATGAKPVRTVHYRLTVDAADYDAGTDTKGTPETPVEMDVWTDAEDRPVQIVTVATVQSIELRSTLLYGRYGEPVRIVAPPEDKVSSTPPADALP